jgi:hypothetical protein
LGLGLGTATALGAAWPGADDSSHHVYGDVSGKLPEGFGPYTGDPVRFTLDARGEPGTITGTFTALHRSPSDGEVVADFAGDITCLMTAGEVATATGVITNGHADLPGQGSTDVTGQKVSFTVQDDGNRDRIFWMWEFFGAPLNDCQGLAPIFRPSHGDLHVRD